MCVDGVGAPRVAKLGVNEAAVDPPGACRLAWLGSFGLEILNVADAEQRR
jgi:hypothetical protein